MPNYDSMSMRELIEYLQQRRPELEIDSLSPDEFEKVFVAVAKEDQETQDEEAMRAQEAENARLAEEARLAQEAENARILEENRKELENRQNSLNRILDWFNSPDKDVKKLQRIVFEENRMTKDMEFDGPLTSSLVEYFTRNNDHEELSESLRRKRVGLSDKSRVLNDDEIYQPLLRILKKTKADEILNVPSKAIVDTLKVNQDFSPVLEELCGQFNILFKDLPKYYELRYPDGQRFYNPKQLNSQVATFVNNSLTYFNGLINESKKEITYNNNGKQITKTVNYSPILPLVATCILARTLPDSFSKNNKGINNALEELENFIEPFIAATIDQRSIGFVRERNPVIPTLKDPAMIPSVVQDSVKMIDRMLWLAHETSFNLEGLKERISKGKKLDCIMQSGKFLHDIALIQRLKPVSGQTSEIPSDIDQGAEYPLSYVNYGGVEVPVFNRKDQVEDDFYSHLTNNQQLLAAFATGNPAHIRAVLKVKQDMVAGKFDPSTPAGKTRAANPENILKVAVFALLAVKKTNLVFTESNIDFAENLVEGYADVIIECESFLGTERFNQILQQEVNKNNENFAKAGNFLLLTEHSEIPQENKEESTQGSEAQAKEEKKPNAFVGEDEMVVKKQKDGGRFAFFGSQKPKAVVKSEDDIALAYRNGVKNSVGCWFTFVDSVSKMAIQMSNPDDESTQEIKAHTSKLAGILTDREMPKRRKMIFDMLKTGALDENKFASTYRKFEKDCPVAVRVLEEVIRRSIETQATLVKGKPIPTITVPEDDEKFRDQKNTRNKIVRSLEKEAIEHAQSDGKELALLAVAGEFGLLENKKSRKKTREQKTTEVQPTQVQPKPDTDLEA